MENQWRSSPQPSEQEPPAAQQAEAIPGVGAAPGEISRKEKVCGECGRPYSRAHEKELGKVARKTVREMTGKHTPPDMRDDSLLDLKQPLAIPPETRFWSQDTPEKKLRDGMRGKDGEFMVARMHWILNGLHDALYGNGS